MMPDINSEDEDHTFGTYNLNSNVMGLWSWGETFAKEDAHDDSTSSLSISNLSSVDSSTRAAKGSSLWDVNAGILDSGSNQKSKKEESNAEESDVEQWEFYDCLVHSTHKEDEKDEEEEIVSTKDDQIKAVIENVELNPIEVFDKNNSWRSTVTEEENAAHVDQAVEEALNRARTKFLQKQDRKRDGSLKLSDDPMQPIGPGSYHGTPPAVDNNNIINVKPHMKQKRRSSMASTSSYHNTSTVGSSTASIPWSQSREPIAHDSEAPQQISSNSVRRTHEGIQKPHLKPRRRNSLKPTVSYDGVPTVNNSIISAKPHMKQKRRSSMASTSAYHNASTIGISTLNASWPHSRELIAHDPQARRQRRQTMLDSLEANSKVISEMSIPPPDFAKPHRKQKRRSSMASTSASHNAPKVENSANVSSSMYMDRESSEASAHDSLKPSSKKKEKKKKKHSKAHRRSSLETITGSCHIPLIDDNNIISTKLHMKQKRRSSMASTSAYHNASTNDISSEKKSFEESLGGPIKPSSKKEDSSKLCTLPQTMSRRTELESQKDTIDAESVPLNHVDREGEKKKKKQHMKPKRRSSMASARASHIAYSTNDSSEKKLFEEPLCDSIKPSSEKKDELKSSMLPQIMPLKGELVSLNVANGVESVPLNHVDREGEKKKKKQHMKQKRRSSMASTSAYHNASSVMLPQTMPLKAEVVPLNDANDVESSVLLNDLNWEDEKMKRRSKPRRRSSLRCTGAYNGASTVDNDIVSSKPHMKQMRRSSMASTSAYHNASTVENNDAILPSFVRTDMKSSGVSADVSLKSSSEKKKKKKKHLKPQRHWTTGCYHIPSTADNDINAKPHLKQKRRSSLASTSACHNDPTIDNYKAVYNWWDLSNALELDNTFVQKNNPLPTCTEMENESLEESVEVSVDDSFKKSSKENETKSLKSRPQSNLGMTTMKNTELESQFEHLQEQFDEAFKKLEKYHVPSADENDIIRSSKLHMKQKRRSSMASTSAHHNALTVEYNAILPSSMGVDKESSEASGGDSLKPSSKKKEKKKKKHSKAQRRSSMEATGAYPFTSADDNNTSSAKPHMKQKRRSSMASTSAYHNDSTVENSANLSSSMHMDRESSEASAHASLKPSSKKKEKKKKKHSKAHRRSSLETTGPCHVPSPVDNNNISAKSHKKQKRRSSMASTSAYHNAMLPQTIWLNSETVPLNDADAEVVESPGKTDSSARVSNKKNRISFLKLKMDDGEKTKRTKKEKKEKKTSPSASAKKDRTLQYRLFRRKEETLNTASDEQQQQGKKGKKAKKKVEKKDKDKAEKKNKRCNKERTLRDLLFRRKEYSFVADSNEQKEEEDELKPPVMVSPSLSPQISKSGVVDFSEQKMGRASMLNQCSNSVGYQSSGAMGFASSSRSQHEYKPQRSRSTDTPPVMALPSMSPQVSKSGVVDFSGRKMRPASMSSQYSNSVGSQSSAAMGSASCSQSLHESKPQRSRSTDTPPVMALPSMSPQVSKSGVVVFPGRKMRRASISSHDSNPVGSQSSAAIGADSSSRSQQQSTYQSEPKNEQNASFQSRRNTIGGGRSTAENDPLLSWDFGKEQAAPIPKKKMARRSSMPLKMARRSSMKGRNGSTESRASLGRGDQVEVLLPLQDKPIMKRRSITLSDDVEVKTIERVTEMDGKKEELWFQAREFRNIKRRTYREADQAIKGCKEVDTRGLENILDEATMDERVDEALDVVLDVQDIQFDHGRFDETQISALYTLSAVNSKVDARLRANQDARAVESYLRETRRMMRRISI